MTQGQWFSKGSKVKKWKTLQGLLKYHKPALSDVQISVAHYVLLFCSEHQQKYSTITMQFFFLSQRQVSRNPTPDFQTHPRKDDLGVEVQVSLSCFLLLLSQLPSSTTLLHSLICAPYLWSHTKILPQMGTVDAKPRIISFLGATSFSWPIESNTTHASICLEGIPKSPADPAFFIPLQFSFHLQISLTLRSS